MVSYTNRTGLGKSDGPEPQDIAVINKNFDSIDADLGCILVNDGVTPATVDLYDGAIVKEKTSGIVWVAQKNVGGTYDKKYIKYPWHLYATSGAMSGNLANNTWADFPFWTFAAGVNSDASAITSGTVFNIPIAGIYEISLGGQWAGAATARRGMRTLVGVNLQVLNDATSGLAQNLSFTRNLPAGYTTRMQLFQDSGASIPYATAINQVWFAMTMVTPT